MFCIRCRKQSMKDKITGFDLAQRPHCEFASSRARWQVGQLGRHSGHSQPGERSLPHPQTARVSEGGIESEENTLDSVVFVLGALFRPVDRRCNPNTRAEERNKDTTTSFNVRIFGTFGTFDEKKGNKNNKSLWTKKLKDVKEVRVFCAKFFWFYYLEYLLVAEQFYNI
ncbi:hypothetical protein PHYBLDRAFT_162676 [Phycomyces blakesleeanus NRRL 1555(-)]|uniref:Uncharacterized protein n=1 Tax=Phycomyces blakesleeanus (strain ATCC 8743b / DSM 1359 / FGSC 10004 / NBRC 33097 / NRRL 1555) TaxID=763407 RepID=A0A162Q1P5_PHYB8|nr:hypothetical protein PHYBLDRAFT_162676 [Phycomyces blakesleeanus NRRL 1555(-)]OAD79617.1 hypothetical protein PHYBLDRAFT_162676 [Phycomyces blakesleeanus NRRL 1555(-)]|eukprot:XP_018297657.1 hypothetical protein PHYBLDRAFT_162676 [Phycomyces blakesleeanus NRRL 1555(-)]